MKQLLSIPINSIDVICIKQLGDCDIGKIDFKSSQGKLSIRSESLEDYDL